MAFLYKVIHGLLVTHSEVEVKLKGLKGAYTTKFNKLITSIQHMFLYFLNILSIYILIYKIFKLLRNTVLKQNIFT